MATTLLESRAEMRTSLQRECDELTRPAGATSRTERTPGILVVDDQAFDRVMLDIELRRHGFAVWLASDGQEALELYQRHRAEIELVLLDVRMPGMDGPETLAALRALNPEIRCCFLAGHSGSFVDDELLKHGAMAVLHKTFHPDRVAPVICQLLGLPEIQDSQKGSLASLRRWLFGQSRPRDRSMQVA
jgi:CheY-like chemotaxis protein